MESSGSEKPPVRVNIFHQTYTLRTAGSERDLQELADSVDQIMSAISAKAANADSLRVAVLACLHLADRLRSTERELSSLRGQVEAKARRLLELLDKEFR